MAYTSATMNLMVAPIGGTGPQIWTYTTADTITDVDAAGYVSDGSAKGMRAGDLVIIYHTGSTLHYSSRVESVTAGGAANLGLAVATTSATTGD